MGLGHTERAYSFGITTYRLNNPRGWLSDTFVLSLWWLGINPPAEQGWVSRNLPQGKSPKEQVYTVSVLGREEGCTVKYNHLPEGVPEGEA